MGHLVYCVFETSERTRPANLQGVGGGSVRRVGHNGLSAAVSEFPGPASAPQPHDLGAHHGIVVAFFEQQAVIPMRYGTTFQSEAKIHRFLEDKNAEYLALLRELEGGVEMGLRILIDKPKVPANSSKQPSVLPGDDEAFLKSGKAAGRVYLARKKDAYARQDQEMEHENSIAADIRGRLAGLALQARVEVAQMPTGRLLSLYFMVRRGRVEAFRQAVSHELLPAHPKLLLTGPWPPYNFVTKENR